MSGHERGPHHHRISVSVEEIAGVPCLVVLTTPSAGTGLSPTRASAELSSLESAPGIRKLVQWAERLPWDNEEMRSRHASYHESIFVERCFPGVEPGWEIRAFNDFTEEFTDGTVLPDSGIADPETWRAVLQWAESLGTLT